MLADGVRSIASKTVEAGEMTDIDVVTMYDLVRGYLIVQAYTTGQNIVSSYVIFIFSFLGCIVGLSSFSLACSLLV